MTKEFDARKAIEEVMDFRENMEAFCEYQKLLADTIHTQYEYLLEAGFSETQALEIIKARGTGL